MSAGVGRRVAALAYDALLCVALLMIFTALAMLLTHGQAITTRNVGSLAYLYRLGLVGVVAAYFVICCARTGHTLGMRAWRLALVTPSGQPVGAGRILWRFLVATPAWLLAAAGVFWIWLDPQGLALQDRISVTRVVVLR
jgi:uncharacterized RDD family membrane protein YckC